MTALTVAVTDAIAYVSAQDVEVPPDVWADVVRCGALKATGDLAAINAAYHDAITESLITYFEGGSLAASKNSFKRAMIEAFGGAWDAGWDGNPPTGEALEWFNARTQQELAFIDGLYVQAKELRKDPEADTFAWATARADGYTGTVSSVHNAARMWAKGGQMLTWHLGATEEHCETCAELDGKTHRASWYISRDYIPRKPGAAMLCGGYYCDCDLKDKNGNSILGGDTTAAKHMGPGNHPSGTPQSVHGGQGLPYPVVGDSPTAFLIEYKLKELPENHMDGLRSVDFIENQFAQSRDATGKITEAYGVYWPSRQIIQMSSNEDNVRVIGGGTIVHEVGHHVHLYKMTDEGAAAWAAISKNGATASISAYARTNQGEHFAEVYRAYMLGGDKRKKLKALEPQSYKFMRGIDKHLLPIGEYANTDNWFSRYEG